MLLWTLYYIFTFDRMYNMGLSIAVRTRRIKSLWLVVPSTNRVSLVLLHERPRWRAISHIWICCICYRTCIALIICSCIWIILMPLLHHITAWTPNIWLIRWRSRWDLTHAWVLRVMRHSMYSLLLWHLVRNRVIWCRISILPVSIIWWLARWHTADVTPWMISS